VCQREGGVPQQGADAFGAGICALRACGHDSKRKALRRQLTTKR
jgi:hypothetical protein